jgi:hypothetical protein
MSVRLACQGKTKSEGGMNVPDLKALVKDLDPSRSVVKMNRKYLLKRLCGVCTKMNFLSRNDILSDFKYDAQNNKYTYKGKRVFPEKTFLASGQYGNVHEIKFKYDGKTHKVVKKTGAIDDEIELLQNRPEVLDCPGLVNMVYMHNAIYMPLASGDLDLLKGMVSHQQTIDIMINLKTTLLCLEEKNAYYFDIKLANILFSCYGNNDKEVYFGDLGSINQYNIATLPPPEFPSGRINIDTVPDPTKIYVYQLALLYAQLRIPYMELIEYPLFDLNRTNYKKRLSIVMTHVKSLGPHTKKISDVLETVHRENTIKHLPALRDWLN